MCTGEQSSKQIDVISVIHVPISTSAKQPVEAPPMLFPMYTVASHVLLQMTSVEPHEKLKAEASSGVDN